mmetsp:Transcript_14947/g.36401  ORF Transcript_14947/g.36401 Transcript_14947/m.36401 type:complete len:984 (+) Transcript_14947:152-3103(+)
MHVKELILLIVVECGRIHVDAWSFPDPSLPAGSRPRPYSDHSDMPPSYNDMPPSYDDGLYDIPPAPFYNGWYDDVPPSYHNDAVDMQPPSYYSNGYFMPSTYNNGRMDTTQPSYNSQVGMRPPYKSQVDIPPSDMTAAQVDKNGVDIASRVDFSVATHMSTMDNPLLHQENCLPKFSRIRTHHISPALEEKISTMKMEFELFESYLNMSSSSSTTLKAGNLTKKNSSEKLELSYLLDELDSIKHTLDHTWNIVSHLQSVKNDNELRQIYDLNQRNVLKATSQFSQSKPLFDALQKLLKQRLKSNETDTLKKALSNTIKGNLSSASVKSIITEKVFEQQQEQRAVENILRSMKEGGVGMKSKEDQERLNEIQLRLASLATKFSNNILDETQALFMTVLDRSSMQGVPQSILLQWNNAHRKEMARQGYSGGSDARSPNDPLGYNGWSSNGPVSYEEQQYEEELRQFAWKAGPWRVTMDQSSYLSAMKHIPNRELRRQIYLAHLQRASEISSPDKNNIPVIEEILRLKKEMAKLLGYDSYAELSLSSKMASSTDAITKLTDLVAEKALPAAKKELEEITKFAHASGGLMEMDETGRRYSVPLQHWDIPYWTERLKESKFDFTEEELRPYFSHNNVIQGLFQLVNRLFDVTIKEDVADTWHADVSFYNLYDNANGGKHIASFYLDPYFRPMNKRGGAWMSSCVAKSRALDNDLPVAYVSYNVEPPGEGGRPSLLTFREVETVFHEFGHALQHLLTTASVGEVSGINGIEWDAVEIPSQFMERWCYDRDTLYSFARHWRTHQPLPEAMYDKLLQQKVFGAGMKTCKQLYYGQLDLALHGSGSSKKAQDNPSYFSSVVADASSIFDIQRDVAKKYLPPSMMPPLLKEDRYLCSFSHIFAGGYSAGYYSYLWADLMSADAFGAFEAVLLNDDSKNKGTNNKKEEELKLIGKRFRDTFLSLGGGIPPDQVFEIFRGRSPTPKALLEQSGLQ